jgi:anti-anti-sigma factor
MEAGYTAVCAGDHLGDRGAMDTERVAFPSWWRLHQVDILQDTHGDTVVLTPRGRIDSANATAFEESLTREINGSRGTVIVDCQALDYISSAGLRAILIGAKLAKPKGRKLLLCSLKPNVHEVFAVSGFTKVLTILDDREAALAAA